MITASNIMEYAVWIGAAVVFLLIIIVWIEFRILKLLSQEEETKDTVVPAPSCEINNKESGQLEYSEGQTKIRGFEEDEIAAAIIAVVSYEMNLPLHAIKIKSIKRIEDAIGKGAMLEGAMRSI